MVALGRDAEARDDYSVVIAADPGIGAAYAGRAEAHCRLGEVAASVDDRREALRRGALTPDLVIGHLRDTGYLRGTEFTDADRDAALLAWTEAGCP